MALKAIYPKQEDIPEEFRDLYSERNGQWELTGIEGVKTQADVDRLQTSLTKEREDHRDTKEKLKGYDGVDLEKVTKNEEELAETKIRLDAALKGGDGMDDEAINKLVEARVATQVRPVERELDKLKEDHRVQGETVANFEAENTRRTIVDAVRSAGVDSKIIDTAMDDVLMLAERQFEVTDDGQVLTRDGVGVTPGITAETWFPEMQDKRPHWWPTSSGGGAGGSGGGAGFSNNPFSSKDWNLTKQGQEQRADPGKATRMAAAAGTTVGGPRPIEKSV